MAERLTRSDEGDSQPEQAEQSMLSRALYGVAVLLRLDSEERDALASHFLPDQSNMTPVIREKVAGAVESLMRGYFEANRLFLMTPAWNPEQHNRQVSIKRQRSIIRRLTGSRRDALPPQRLDDVIALRPDLRDQIIDVTTDAFLGMLANFAQQRGVDIARLVGKVGLEGVINPAMQPVADEASLLEVIDEPTTPVEDDDEAVEDEFAEAWEGIDTSIPRVHEYKLDAEPSARVRWSVVAELSKRLGRLEEERNDPQWWVPQPLDLASPNQNPAAAYLNTINHPLLTEAQVKVLHERMEAGREALEKLREEIIEADGPATQALQRVAVIGYRARQILIEHNLRLVRDIALRFGRWWELDDIVQGGNVGLVASVDRYNPYPSAAAENREPAADEERRSITTITTYYARGTVLRTVQQESRAAFARMWAGRDVIGGVSEEDRRLLFRVYEESKRLGYSATYHEVGEWLGFSAKKVDSLINHRTTSRIVSIEQSVDDPESALFPSMMKAISDQEAGASAVNKINLEVSRHSFWRDMQRRLPPRYYQVLVMQYVYGLSHHAIAAQVGVTRQRIQQIHKGAIGKLREDLGIVVEEPEKQKQSRELDGPSALLCKLGVDTSEGDLEVHRETAIELLGQLALKPDETTVVSMRYGLDNPAGRLITRQQVADILGLDKEKVRYIDGKVIGKLQRLRAKRQ